MRVRRVVAEEAVRPLNWLSVEAKLTRMAWKDLAGLLVYLGAFQGRKLAVRSMQRNSICTAAAIAMVLVGNIDSSSAS